MSRTFAPEDRSVKKVRMLYDDPEVEGDVNVRYVPIKDVAEYMRKYKKYNMRIDKRGLSGMQKFALGAADIAPAALSMVGDVAGPAVGAAGTGLLAPSTGGASLASAPAAIAAGRVLGGSLGGATGQAIKEGVYRQMGFGDAPGTVGEEALLGAGSSLVGIPVEAGINKVASPFLAKMALGFKNPYATKEVIQNVLRNKYIVKTQGAIDAAEKVLQKAKLERLLALRKATQLGAKASSKQVVTAMEHLIEELSATGLGKQAQSLARELTAFKTDLVKQGGGFVKRLKPNDMSLRRAQKYVSTANDMLESYYMALGGKPSKSALPPSERFTVEAADRLRGQLRDIVDRTLGKPPGWYKAMNEKIGELVATKSALEIAKDASRFSGPQAVAGAGLAVGGLGAALTGGGSKAGTAASVAGLSAVAPEFTSWLASRLPGIAGRTVNPVAHAVVAASRKNQDKGYGAVPVGPVYSWEPTDLFPQGQEQTDTTRVPR